jgi:hypothetical protein
VSQQINLLVKKQERPAVSAERTSIAIALLLAASITYALVERKQTAKVVDSANRMQAQVASQKAALKTLEEKIAGRPKGEELATEVAWLRDVAAGKHRVLEMLRAGSGGSESGYHAHLVALARISENGVWLSQVQISEAGTRISVAGGALDPDAVVRYAQRLNEQFAPFGAKFTTLEMTAPSATPGAPAVVAFHLK